MRLKVTSLINEQKISFYHGDRFIKRKDVLEDTDVSSTSSSNLCFQSVKVNGFDTAQKIVLCYLKPTGNFIHYPLFTLLSMQYVIIPCRVVCINSQLLINILC